MYILRAHSYVAGKTYSVLIKEVSYFRGTHLYSWEGVQCPYFRGDFIQLGRYAVSLFQG